MTEKLRVELTYFKEGSGKFYSSAEYEPIAQEFYAALTEIKELLKKGSRPGLVNGHEFHVLVTIYWENGSLPHLFTRDQL